jgi:hypothetical protein
MTGYMPMAIPPRSPRPPTTPQLRVLEVIYRRFQENGYYPSQSEIRESIESFYGLDWSLSYIKQIIAAIHKKGYITREVSERRGNVRLTEHALVKLGVPPSEDSPSIHQQSLFEEVRRRA